MNATTQNIAIGDLHIDLDRQTVTRAGNRIDLPGLSFRLLKALAERRPDTVSRRDLVRAVWGDVVVSDDALRQRVRLLRQALGNADYIAAVKGIGYRLTCPVHRAASPDRRRKLLVAASFAAVGLVAAFFLGGELANDLIHEIRHAMRH